MATTRKSRAPVASKAETQKTPREVFADKVKDLGEGLFFKVDETGKISYSAPLKISGAKKTLEKKGEGFVYVTDYALAGYDVDVIKALQNLKFSQQEIDTALDSAFDINTINPNVEGNFAADFQRMVEEYNLRKQGAEKKELVLPPELALRFYREYKKERAATRGQGKSEEEKKVSKKGKRGASLADKLKDLPADKALNVSKVDDSLTDTGKTSKVIISESPVKLFGIKAFGGKLVSDNEIGLRNALRKLGVPENELERHLQEWRNNKGAAAPRAAPRVGKKREEKKAPIQMKLAPRPQNPTILPPSVNQ